MLLTPRITALCALKAARAAARAGEHQRAGDLRLAGLEMLGALPDNVRSIG